MDAGIQDRDEDAPPLAGRGLEPGQVLNGIYRVERFVSRGGMGDVYAGVNVETEERVAIKAMLPRLAADPKILSLFRSEARLLTRVSHPAVARYRVFARDPRLGIHYLVTDFIDGEALTSRLCGAPPTSMEVERLLRRLATGLCAPHAIGAIHRDMSPDNILLPGGRIDDATIIDFGIARYVEPDDRTVVIEGFAGKLGYVAPEQFGLFSGAVGPWTDIYSTALVTLAFASAGRIEMGRTIVEAVERRRLVPDLDRLPERLRPMMRAMLAPDPAERIASMEAVITALDASVPLAPRGSSDLAAPVAEATRKSLRGRWLALASVVIASIALALVVFASAWNRRAVPAAPAAVTRPQRAVERTASPARVASVTMPASKSVALPSLSSSPIALEADPRPGGLRTAANNCVRSAGVWSGVTVSGVVEGRGATLLFVRPAGGVTRLLVGDPPRAIAPAKLLRIGTGRYRVGLCLHEAGDGAFLLVADAGALPLFTARSSSVAVERFRALAAQRGGATRVAWVSIKPPPSVELASATREDSASEARASTAVALGAGAALLPASGGCKRFMAGTWYDLGTLPRAACIATAFDRDRVVYAHIGKMLVRRYAGALEVQRGGAWHRIGTDPTPAGSTP